MLNDVHGIQVRGGCSCAGTYGHYLLNIDRQHSKSITNEIDKGHYFTKPGWVRLSLHPTMTEKDVTFISNAISDVVSNVNRYKKDYEYLPECNDYQHGNECNMNYGSWFDLTEKGYAQNGSAIN